MLRFEIKVGAVLMLLITSGSSVAQVLSGQCNLPSGSCSQSSSQSTQPEVTHAVSLVGQEPAPRVTVTYVGKLLSVQAHGVSFRSILALIGKRTGTVIELGAGSDSGSAYVDLGPETVHDLLRDLLNGSQLNYVMVRSSSDPGFVERLVILGNESEPASTDHSPPAVVAVGQPVPPKLYGTGFAANPEEGDSTPSVPTPAEQQSAPPAIAAQPTVDPSILKYQQQYQQAMADAASSGKSRADILEELQKLQQKELDDQYMQSQPH
jgi:hypothetical protein